MKILKYITLYNVSCQKIQLNDIQFFITNKTILDKIHFNKLLVKELMWEEFYGKWEY